MRAMTFFIGAQTQPCHHIVIGVACREEYDRNCRRGAVFFQASDKSETVHTFHHDIEKEQVKRGDAEPKSLLGALGDCGIVSLELEVFAKSLADTFLVVNNQYFSFSIVHKGRNDIKGYFFSALPALKALPAQS